MHILLATASMDYSGTPTYVVTIGQALSRLGVSVSYLTKAQGKLGRIVGAHTSPKDLSSQPDIIIVQHSSVAKWCYDALRGVPMIFHHHGGPLSPDHCPRHIPWAGILSINHQCTQQMRRERITDEITLMRDVVDRTLYTSREPIRTSHPRVLFLSNYKRWRNYQRIADACERMGLPLQCVGSPYGHSENVSENMQQADLVVTWGRGVLEAAACGRPVISYDLELGDGYLTPSRFLDSRERNFSGYECRYTMGVTELCDALAQYNPADGTALAEIVATDHDVVVQANELVSYCAARIRS